MKKTSIIILTYNQLAYTKICLESVRLFTKSSYEIIVVDNASTDGTVEWLKAQKDIITVFNSENRGFPAGCNQGIRQAAGDVLILLNNDTVVTPRWLDNLLVCLNSSEKIGAVVPCSNIESDFADDALNNYQKTDFAQIISFGEDFNVSNPLKWEERVRIGGFCFAVKKSVVAEVGLLDEQFFPGYSEDDDYSFRIRRAGYKLMRLNDTFVHHYHNATTGSDPFLFEKSPVFIAENQKKFFAKWGFYSPHHTVARDEIINLMNKSDSFRNIRVLEIGCGCGATLLKIKRYFPEAQLFGIEQNENAAQSASAFAAVKAGEAETINFDYPRNYFDYILLNEILQHLVDPWAFLRNLRQYLRPIGQIITSVPNIAHYSIFAKLLTGNWIVDSSGVSDKTNLRFFTLETMRELFENNGYSIKQIQKEITSGTGANNFLNYLSKAAPPEKRAEVTVVNYRLTAQIK